MVRTLACHARGPGFESPSGRQFASVAQLVEQGTENPRVVGSIPTGGTIYADLAHLVERDLAKVEVAGSSPVIRSKKERHSLWVSFFFGTHITELCRTKAALSPQGFAMRNLDRYNRKTAVVSSESRSKSHSLGDLR